METTEMTPEKSLQIINDAIEKSRKDFEKDSGLPMILWGTVVLVFSLAVCIMINLTDNLNWNFLWFGIIVVGWPLSAILLKGKCKSGGKSFISHTIGQIWISYGIFATVLSAVFAFVAPQFTGYITAVLLGFAAAKKQIRNSRRIHYRYRLHNCAILYCSRIHTIILHNSINPEPYSSGYHDEQES